MTEMTSEVFERKKPGPKPKPKIDPEDLLVRIEALERLIAVIAHQSGIPNTTLIKEGITPYSLQKKDLHRYG